jgi:glycosyltransferase involved in cell wall biosynthesis
LAFHRFEKPWKNWIYILLEKIAAAKCHKIYAVAQAMIDQCLAAGIGKKEQYQVVYSGMELEPFLTSEKDEDLRKELNIPESAKVLGTVARLFPLKGYEELFK